VPTVAQWNVAVEKTATEAYVTALEVVRVTPVK
jgi:hypothetical protein